MLNQEKSTDVTCTRQIETNNKHFSLENSSLLDLTNVKVKDMLV